MKIYPSNNLQPVNSVARQPTELIIPPFNYIGPMNAYLSISDRWYGPTNFQIIGGYVTASSGVSALDLYIYKNNIFQSGVTVGTATLAGSDTKALFTMEDPLNGTTFSPYDWITIGTAGASGHDGLVVQLTAIRIN